jgi:RimJ/RimL family protein N-acetyltransferase
MRVPELSTRRLLMRGFRPADFDAFADVWADPAVTRRVGVPARDRSESWGAFVKIAGGWALLGYGQWAVFDRETGRYCGQTGFFRAMRGHGPAFDELPEAGWVLGRDWLGQGIGAEAAGAAHEWFDATVGGPTVCQIDARNEVSQKLAARMGYRPFAELEDENGTPLLLFRRG